MKKIFTFLCITLIVILIEHAYFEYVVSRELIEWISALLTLGALMVFVSYSYYVYKLLSDILKINK